MPGPIQPGEWNICLGAYKVTADGCHCQIEIKLTSSVVTTEPTFPELLTVRTISPRPKNLDNWYNGELHCHTVHSDGDSTVEDVIHIAESLRLDFLAITDHNNRSHLIDMARTETDLILIPGCEVTTYYGHWNIWGSAAWIDFRVQSPGDLQRAIQEADKQGYLVSCNHPRPYGPAWAFPEVRDFACVEIWNGPWELLNDVCLAFWETNLKEGQRLIAVGGSDFHFAKLDHIAKLAHPTTYIYCPEEPSAANLLKNLRAGHSFVTESASGPRLDLRSQDAMMGDNLVISEPVICTLTVQGGAGTEAQICTDLGIVARFQITQESYTYEYRVDPNTSRYIRTQLVNPVTNACLAATNPIYLNSPIT